jgi:hypothetical protein
LTQCLANGGGASPGWKTAPEGSSKIPFRSAQVAKQGAHDQVSPALRAGAVMGFSRAYLQARGPSVLPEFLTPLVSGSQLFHWA